MTEHPILFSGEMVRAILDGRKTQTRRVVKFPPHTYKPTADWVASVNPDGKDGWVAWGPHKMTDEDSRKAYPNGGGFKCPYGAPGDLLWVRETWVKWDGGIAYRADCLNRRGVESDDSKRARLDYGVKWRPSIHMPRWASRITLRVADVRVERVQEISEVDAYAEGCPGEEIYAGNGNVESFSPTSQFAELWDSINAARGFGWESNPWVWVVEFERVTP